MKKLTQRSLISIVLIVFFVLMVILFFGLFSIFTLKEAKASSVICDQIIYTETNSPNTILYIQHFVIVNITKVGFFKTRVTVYPWDLKGKGNGGVMRDGYITFPISKCLYVTDVINSIDNLKWYIEIH